MSNPTHRLMTDERAALIEDHADQALAQGEWLPPLARQFALATKALLKDRQARCELMVSHQK